MFGKKKNDPEATLAAGAVPTAVDFEAGDYRDPAVLAASRERARTGRDPTLPDNHPINAMSKFRKEMIVISLAYAGFLCNFSIAICNVAFPLVGHDLHVSPGAIGNALGYNLLGAAIGPLIWNPLSRCIGRRPVYLIGSFLFLPACVWQALANNYPCFVVGRVFAGIVSSWSQTVPPASIADIFVPEVRGSKMSHYAVPTVLGPVIVPIFAALIVRKHSWRNLFWFNLGLAGLSFLLIVFVTPETMWNEYPEAHEHDHVDTPPSTELSKINAADNNVTHLEEKAPRTTPVHPRAGYVGALFWPHKDWKRFWPLLWSSIQMFSYITVSVPSFYYGLCLGFLSVGVTVVFPQIFAEPPFNFALIPLGAAYLAFGIGGVLGKFCGGVVSDKIVAYWERRHGRHRQPEDRLWAGYPMLPLMFLGLLLCGLGVQLQLHWMCYLVGGALCFFSLSGITTVIITYILESDLPRAMDTQAVFTFWKFIWGFVVPFFAMDWGHESGWIVCYVGQGIILLVGGFLMLFGLIWKGYSIRKAQGMPIISK